MRSENKKYRTLEDYDVFICNEGRVQVSKGAEYEEEISWDNTKRVFFLNTKNYLPFKAVKSFLETKRELLN